MLNKVGVLCTYAFPEGMAPTIRILSYGQGLIENGCSVEVVVFQPKVCDDRYPLSGYVGGVKYTYSHKRDSSRSTLYKCLVDRPKALFNALRILRESDRRQKFDCILLSFDSPLYMFFFAPVLRFMGFRLGFVGDEFPEPIRRLKNSIPFYYKWTYKFVYHFISFRVLMTTALREYYDSVVCVKPTHILCSILNTGRFDGISRRTVSRKYICYMGNMMLAKDNVDNIIRAFCRICDDFKDINLHLYGTPDDKDRDFVQNVISELKLNDRVFIKGRINYDSVPQVLADAEILVTSQPNTKRAAGGFPTKLAEYMMSHTPVIATDVGEIRNYVHDGETIFMVEPCDDFAYAEKMKYILTHPCEAKAVSDRAYDYAVRNFGARQVAEGLVEFLDKTLK